MWSLILLLKLVPVTVAESGISENSLLNEISPEAPFQSLIESVSRGSSHKKKESGANIVSKSKSTIKIFKHSRQHPHL
jgi:hypothetical protein